jgi:hypothetical protein
MSDQSIRARFKDNDWNFTFLLLALVFLLFIYLPLLPDAGFLPLLFGLLLISVFALSQNRRTFLISASLALPALILNWLAASQSPPSRRLKIAALTVIIAFVFYVMVVILREVMTTRHVTIHVLSGAFCGYLLLGLLWALVYLSIDIIFPGRIHYDLTESGRIIDVYNIEVFSTLLYFSFATITTAGYGDVTPITQIARSTAMLEAATNQFYLVVVVASLVARYVGEYLENSQK